MNCTVCGQVSCNCIPSVTFTPPQHGVFSTSNGFQIVKQSDAKFEIGFKENDTTFKVANDGKLLIESRMDYPLLNLFNMYLLGKTFEKHTSEYLEQILRMPEVDGDKLKAMAVFNRFRKLVRIL